MKSTTPVDLFFVLGDLEAWVADQMVQPDPEDVMAISAHLRNVGAVEPSGRGYWISSQEIPEPIEALL